MIALALLVIIACLAALGTEPALNGWTALAVVGAVVYLATLAWHERNDDNKNEEDLP